MGTSLQIVFLEPQRNYFHADDCWSEMGSQSSVDSPFIWISAQCEHNRAGVSRRPHSFNREYHWFIHSPRKQSFFEPDKQIFIVFLQQKEELCLTVMALWKTWQIVTGLFSHEFYFDQSRFQLFILFFDWSKGFVTIYFSSFSPN